MSAPLQALCYFYRNPPPGSAVKPQPYKTIPKLIGAPNIGTSRVKMAVRRFHLKRRTRGRKAGWRKTTPAEGAAIFASFKRAHQPLGSLVEAHDVWKALPASLRSKVTMRAVSNRLREKGSSMQEKLAGDDEGQQWMLRRLRFSKPHASRAARQWPQRVLAVADFRYFVYYPKSMKTRYKRKSAPRTIMHKRGRKTSGRVGRKEREGGLMDLLGGAAIPPRFRRGSVWILPRFRRGSARFRAVPRGSVPKSNKIAAWHEHGTHGKLCSEKCVFHS